MTLKPELVSGVLIDIYEGEGFGRAVVDSYEKRTAGKYTESDRKMLREAFDKTANSMEDPEYFKDFYWHFCKNYDLW